MLIFVPSTTLLTIFSQVQKRPTGSEVRNKWLQLLNSSWIDSTFIVISWMVNDTSERTSLCSISWLFRPRHITSITLSLFNKSFESDYLSRSGPWIWPMSVGEVRWYRGWFELMINFPANCMGKYLKRCIDTVRLLVDHHRQLQYRRMHLFELHSIASICNRSILRDPCRLYPLFLNLRSWKVNQG